MKMVRHDHKLVKKIDPAVSILKESFQHYLGIFSSLKNRAALPAFRGDEIRGAGSCPMSWRRHGYRRFRG
jgi:hypothetical protein